MAVLLALAWPLFNGLTRLLTGFRAKLRNLREKRKKKASIE